MRIIAGLLRILSGLLIIGVIPAVAQAFTDVEVTTAGLAGIVLLLIAMWQISRGAIHMLRPAPSSHTGSSMALGATLRREVQVPDEKPADLRRRARHEAGHALVAHALGHRIVSVSLRQIGNTAPADMTAEALRVAHDLITEHPVAIDAVTDLLVERTVIPGEDVHRLLIEHGVQASPRD